MLLLEIKPNITTKEYLVDAKAKRELLQVRIEEKYLAAPNVIGVIIGR